MPVTIKDVANACGVSFSTVSRVLNGKNIRKNETSKKVLAVAEALHYSPNNIAVQLVKKSSKMLGLLIPDIANPHYSEITKYVEDVAFKNDLQVFLCNTDWDIRKEIMYRNALLEQRVAGLIVMPVCDESHIMFSQLNVPVVLLGSRSDVPGLHYVTMDNFHACCLATETLVKAGCRNLAFISRSVNNKTAFERISAFNHTLATCGVSVAGTIISAQSRWLEGGYLATQELLSRPNPPDGIVAFSDFVALGALRAVSEAGLLPGKDIRIIGFDNILFSSFPSIDLTSVSPPCQDMAAAAIAILKEKKDNGNTGECVQKAFDPILFPRASTGALL